MAALAYTVFLADSPEFPSGQLNPAGYRIYGIVGACAILASILTSSIGTHRHIPTMKKPRPKLPFRLGRIFRELFQTLSNRSFLALFMAGVFSAVATGVTTTDKLASWRPYIIVDAFAIGMLLTPPDVISQTLLALPMWLLFEVGIVMSRILLPHRRTRAQQASDETGGQASS